MKVRTALSTLLAILPLLAAARARAEQCCSFGTQECTLSDHEDRRCAIGSRSEVRLNDVWGCPQSTEIVLADPLTFLITLAIATENARVYCEEQSGNCSSPVTQLCGDSDGDGLWDLWEKQGVDGDDDGAADTYLPGANTLRKDVFVELDWLQSDGNRDGDYSDKEDHSHAPQRDALETAIRTYASAPVSNPDGTTGIQLHIDVGALFGEHAVFEVTGASGVTGSYGDLGGGNAIDELGLETISTRQQVKDIKNQYFDERRRKAFRYALFTHYYTDCKGGFSWTPANNLVVSLGGTKADGSACFGKDANGFSVGTVNQQAASFVHELGHALGRFHGGEQRSNSKPNYYSEMNYLYNFGHVPRSPTRPDLLPGGLDYSRIALPALDEDSLDECAGYDAGLLGFGAIDFDGDGVLEGATCPAPNNSNVAADLNGEALCLSKGRDSKFSSSLAGDDAVTDDKGAINSGANAICETPVADGDQSERPLLSYEDWGSLQLAVLRDGDTANDASIDVEPTPETIEAGRRLLAEQARADVNVEVSAPATVLPGQQIDYRVRLSSQGRGPALTLAATLLAPDGTETHAEVPALVLGASTELSQSYTVPSDACPMDLVQTSLVEYQDMASFAWSSSDVGVSRVLDVTPPVLTLIGPANSVIECNVGSYAEQGALASDTCDLDVPVTVGGDSVQTAQTGSYTVTYSAQDDSGNSSSLSRTVRVADTLPPALSVSLSPSALRPPNHKLIPIVPTLKVSDACDPQPVVSLVSITSNEPVNGTGDGNTNADIVIDSDGRIFLRAERAGSGSGRVYTLTYRADDAAGNVRIVSSTVMVPKT